MSDRPPVDLISIHAPTRGATPAGDGHHKDLHISIHAPTRGATRQRGAAGREPGNFNSRPYARGDGIRIGKQLLGLSISIHAPTRGATELFGNHHSRGNISIHAPTRGATDPAVPEISSRWNFNSRPYARGDARPSMFSRGGRPFQFTPLREGRPGCKPWTIARMYFNSRPFARGAIGPIEMPAWPVYFNSRPYARGDLSSPFISRLGLFQFTPLREGRLILAFNTCAE